MATHTVDVYAFFFNGANSSTNISRIEQDISKANSTWKGCTKFVLEGAYFNEDKIVNAGSIPSDGVFKNRQMDSLIKFARNVTGNKIGIYVFYLNGDFLAEGKGRKVVGASTTEVGYFESSTNYELFGHIVLTDKAAGRYTFAHECGHVLFKRYSETRNMFIHDDPSGPYINFQTGKRDPAHNSDQKNLMFPISPSVNPIVTSQQCQIAKQSKIVRNNIDKYYDYYDFRNT
ncbi:hypothetical protein [Ectobacillus funiculus]|uniref:hypothetical protein n=1 Tax=Ectobacillus funiculus TaxID=137993 RepID=UPI00101DADD2|nr:hypothetical protein [Ectobacillus funiculus]